LTRAFEDGSLKLNISFLVKLRLIALLSEILPVILKIFVIALGKIRWHCAVILLSWVGERLYSY
jgi:hypothetical protein